MGGAPMQLIFSPFFMGSEKPLDRHLKIGRSEVLGITKSPLIVSKSRSCLFYPLRAKSHLQNFIFLVSKTLEGVVGVNSGAKKMESGDLLIEINTKKQSESLLALNSVSM